MPSDIWRDCLPNPLGRGCGSYSPSGCGGVEKILSPSRIIACFSGCHYIDKSKSREMNCMALRQSALRPLIPNISSMMNRVIIKVSLWAKCVWNLPLSLHMGPYFTSAPSCHLHPFQFCHQVGYHLSHNKPSFTIICLPITTPLIQVRYLPKSPFLKQFPVNCISSHHTRDKTCLWHPRVQPTWHSLLRTVYADPRTATSQQQTWPLYRPVALCSMGWHLNLSYKPKRVKTWRVLSLWFHPGCIKCLRLKICFHVCPQYWLHKEFIVTLPTTLTTSPKNHLNVHSFAQQ